MASCVAALVCTLTACDHKVSISNNGVVIVDDCEFIDEEDNIEEEPSE